MPTALIYAMQVLQILPSLISTGRSVLSLVEQTNSALDKMQSEKRDPTPAEWEALNATIAALRSELHAPGT